MIPGYINELCKLVERVEGIEVTPIEKDNEVTVQFETDVAIFEYSTKNYSDLETIVESFNSDSKMGGLMLLGYPFNQIEVSYSKNAIILPNGQTLEHDKYWNSTAQSWDSEALMRDLCESLGLTEDYSDVLERCQEAQDSARSI